MPPTFASILVILVGMYGLRLAYAGQLIYYVHPRYVSLTVVASSVVVIVGIMAFILSPVKRHTRRRTMRGIGGMLPVILFIAAGILLPAKALSSASVEQRSTSEVSQQPVSEDDNGSGVGDVSIVDTSEWTFDDFWYSLTIQDRTLEHYDGKVANLLGFVSRPKAAPEGTFQITRFLVMCCAIDAQTVGFWVQDTPALDTSALQNDTWVQIKGTFRLSASTGKKILVIEPEAIEKTEQPEDPYVY